MLENDRCKLFMELLDVVTENDDPPISELVMLCNKPTGLRAAKDLKKGELVIYPVIASITQIMKDKTFGSVFPLKATRLSIMMVGILMMLALKWTTSTMREVGFPTSSNSMVWEVD